MCTQRRSHGRGYMSVHAYGVHTCSVHVYTMCMYTPCAAYDVRQRHRHDLHEAYPSPYLPILTHGKDADTTYMKLTLIPANPNARQRRRHDLHEASLARPTAMGHMRYHRPCCTRPHPCAGRVRTGAPSSVAHGPCLRVAHTMHIQCTYSARTPRSQ